MPSIHFIRHARASASEANYDQLHETGTLQSRLLGEHFGQHGEHFDAIFVGPHLRHHETLRIARAAAADVGARWPEPIVLEALAEAPYDVLVKNYLMPRLQEDAKLMEMAQRLGASTDDASRELAMRAIWDYMIVLWRSGEIVGSDLESAETFDARMTAAYASIAARVASAERILVMTSNGVIDHFVRAVTGITPAAGESTHKVYNTSITIIEGASLQVLNRVDHIADRALLTYL